MKKILLTGGAGFIGSHVADWLLDHHYEVTVLDNLCTGKKSNLPASVELVEMDIRDQAVHSLWEERKFNSLIHLAAQMDVRKSVEDPLYDSDVNIRGSINLLEAGRKNGLERVIFTSTGGAGYDDNVPFPTPETAPSNPVSPYGIGKITTEHYLRYYRKEYGISFVALRLSNVYGPRQNPHGEAGVIAIFSRKLLEGKQPVIYGDGLQTRDYVFCKDVASAIGTALESDKSDIFNIGTSVETSVVQLFDLIREHAGSDLPVKHAPARGGEVRRSVLDYTKAVKEIGWTPRVQLDRGIRETVEFFSRQIKDPLAR